MTGVSKFHSIYVAQEDFRRLRLIAAALPRHQASGAAVDAPTLSDELDRAIVLPREHLPDGVVTVNCRVEFEDVATREMESYVLTWPEHADAALRRLSVVAPIGTALLGYRVGDEIVWATPGGPRRLRITAVERVEDEPVSDSVESIVARLLYGGR